MTVQETANIIDCATRMLSVPYGYSYNVADQFHNAACTQKLFWDANMQSRCSLHAPGQEMPGVGIQSLQLSLFLCNYDWGQQRILTLHVAQYLAKNPDQIPRSFWGNFPIFPGTILKANHVPDRFIPALDCRVSGKASVVYLPVGGFFDSQYPIVTTNLEYSQVK